MPEDEVVEWHHQLDGHEFEQAPGVDDGQGGLVCSVHGLAKSQTQLSDKLNWTESHQRQRKHFKISQE